MRASVWPACRQHVTSVLPPRNSMLQISPAECSSPDLQVPSCPHGPRLLHMAGNMSRIWPATSSPYHKSRIQTAVKFCTALVTKALHVPYHGTISSHLIAEPKKSNDRVHSVVERFRLDRWASWCAEPGQASGHCGFDRCACHDTTL